MGEPRPLAGQNQAVGCARVERPDQRAEIARNLHRVSNKDQRVAGQRDVVGLPVRQLRDAEQAVGVRPLGEPFERLGRDQVRPARPLHELGGARSGLVGVRRLRAPQEGVYGDACRRAPC